MSKTVTLPPVRIEPEHRDALEQIADEMRPQASVSALVRQAVIEYVRRHQIKAEWAQVSTLGDHEPA